MLTPMNTDLALKTISFKSDEKQHFSAARSIRETVFIVEQEVAEDEEFDEFEATSLHYLLLLNNQAIGTARWRHLGDQLKLERFAVLKPYRGKGYGDVLLQAVLADASKENKPMYLHAQLKAIPFYQRRGFKQVGELFWECDIAHYKMVFNK